MFCPRCHREIEGGALRCPHDGERLIEAPRVDRIDTQPSGQSGAIIGGRYQVRGFLGKGSMARVYLAEDVETKRPVAVKVLDTKFGKDPVAHERFFREASATAAIGHPNIVKILGSGHRGDGSPFIVLEFLFGEPLGDLLRREGALDRDVGLEIAQKTASALGAAHQANVVHRDVKPDNIFLIGEPGRFYDVKVLDFGLAKLAETSFTATGIAVGTVEYMSPEQALTDPVSPRTDVYALGVVMYRMFTGALPFEDAEDLRLLAGHVLSAPPPPSSRRPGFDAGLEALILRALRKHPENRYQSMGELIEDVERLLGRRPGRAPAAGLAREPDAYQPKGPLAKMAVPHFYRQLGLEPPE